jgi:ACS family tartrate transporter-like MFS transporter
VVCFLAVLYFFAVLDRVNIGVAGLTMRADLQLSAAAFGFGAGVFFVGYLLFEIPSNLMLVRFGARVWIARLAITWGLAAMAMALARDATSFAALRFLLGAAEAGFIPGVMFLLGLWFPARLRARVNALLLLGLPLGTAFSAALSSSLLALNGQFGLSGWQWVFILEGLPSVLLGLAALVVLADGPASASWLRPEEKRALAAVLAAEPEPRKPAAAMGEAFWDPVAWRLGLAYFGINASLAGLGLWLPQVVQAFGVTSAIGSGLLASVLVLPGALAMLLWSRRSDVLGDRVGHLCLAATTACIGWLLAAAIPIPGVALPLLALAGAGSYAALSVFWTIPANCVPDQASATSIALIGMVGSTGAFVTVWALGLLRDATGGFSAGCVLVAAILLASSALAWQFRPNSRARCDPNQA